MFFARDSAEEQRLDRVLRSAPPGIRELGSLLTNDVMQSLCRLSDPSNQGKHRNFTVRHVLDSLGLDRTDPTWIDLDSKIGEFERHCQPIREHRNKVLDHNDRDTVVRGDWSGHRVPVVAEVQAAVECLPELVGQIQNTAHGSPQDCSCSFADRFGGEGLLRIAEESLLWREIRLREDELSDQELRAIVQRGQWSRTEYFPPTRVSHESNG